MYICSDQAVLDSETLYIFYVFSTLDKVFNHMKVLVVFASNLDLLFIMSLKLYSHLSKKFVLFAPTKFLYK